MAHQQIWCFHSLRCSGPKSPYFTVSGVCAQIFGRHGRCRLRCCAIPLSVQFPESGNRISSTILSRPLNMLVLPASILSDNVTFSRNFLKSLAKVPFGLWPTGCPVYGPLVDRRGYPVGQVRRRSLSFFSENPSASRGDRLVKSGRRAHETYAANLSRSSFWSKASTSFAGIGLLKR